jgi:transcriptional regulator with XRE-family HTH domain
LKSTLTVFLHDPISPISYQEQLAYEAAVDRSYMSKLEKGASYVGLEIIGKLADVLEVEPTEFFQPVPKRGRRGR